MMTNYADAMNIFRFDGRGRSTDQRLAVCVDVGDAAASVMERRVDVNVA
jgi:hypothetical protein